MELHIRSFKEEGTIVTAILEKHHLQPCEDTGLAPVGLDEPYRIIVGNNPINFVDPWGLFESHWLLRTLVPGQVAWDNALTAIENSDYLSAGIHTATMLGEQVLTVLTFGQEAAFKQGSQCAINTAVRTAPKNLAEQLALDEAKSGVGEEIMGGLIKDPQYPMKLSAKMQHVHKSLDGSKITIHYWKNRITGATNGFKFKQ